VAARVRVPCCLAERPLRLANLFAFGIFHDLLFLSEKWAPNSIKGRTFLCLPRAHFAAPLARYQPEGGSKLGKKGKGAWPGHPARGPHKAGPLKKSACLSPLEASRGHRLAQVID